ncbi:hypothetical protein PVAP13_5KG176007 [Panicum virgatum]|uniref:Uncharacterized protein n=1 Tax=Panicum virgatum TaxID=38727 RepID=A0A8T0SK02_PANVG|nr:hypothetical protein PVAP13_5KG176007 [Panicum virgatum]
MFFYETDVHCIRTYSYPNSGPGDFKMTQLLQVTRTPMSTFDILNSGS